MTSKSQKFPIRMLPQNRTGFAKFKQWKYRRPFPDEYKKPAKALMRVDTEKIPLEKAIDPLKSSSMKNMYNLALLTQQHNEELNYLLNKLQILKKDPFLSPYEAKVLITELLWGKQYLKSSSSKVEALKYYEEELREAYIEARDACNKINNSKLNILPTYIRINTLTISIEDSLHAFCKEGWNLLPRCNSYTEYLSVLQRLGKKDFIRDYHISELLAFPPGTVLYEHPGYIKGKFIYQDKGSCLSSFLLNPKPDSVVFDVCAAPGIKTNHLANIMNGTGLIYANDIHPDRVEKMKSLFGITETNAKVLNLDILNMDYSAYEDVKYILVDPTCTYSGIFYAVGQRMKKFGIMRRQFNSNTILRCALQNFPNVKRVVYTTCSLYSEESEEVVDQAMVDIGDAYTLLNVKEMLWNEWGNVSQLGNMSLGKCLRIVPEYDLCQGYFIAVFERNFDVPIPPYVKKLRTKSGVYNMDELEKVEKITRGGKLIERYVPKDKIEPEHLKKVQELSKLRKKIETVSKQVYMQNQLKMKYVNPNLKKQTNFPASSTAMTSTNTASAQIFETTHSQLYP